MSRFYILGIDQSTQGTKGVLVDDAGRIVGRANAAHDQIVNEAGWVSHDLDQIWVNSLQVLREVVEKTGVDPAAIAGLAITNQRETSAAWRKSSGKPLARAIVWQCARGAQITDAIAADEQNAGLVRETTGLQLSPYFPAAKLAWLLQNEPEVKQALAEDDLALGTMDAYLVSRFTKGKVFRTDYSNASRTQLLNLQTLTWDEKLCRLFGVPVKCLPQIEDSDGNFGQTDLEGFLPHPIPICAVMGDSHGALFGHNCRKSGQIKATYGTGSSVMMNIGSKPVLSSYGLATSLAWKTGGEVSYVLEGNINYTGAVITWLKDDLHMITFPGETQTLAQQANPADRTYLVPAFSGLGAPWWNDRARAVLCGMSRTTGRGEIVKAGVESIAYQINDVLTAMKQDTQLPLSQLCVDGGPTGNAYLMQFQSDISEAKVRIPDMQELSVLGVVYAAGLGKGLYTEAVFEALSYQTYAPKMQREKRDWLLDGWRNAISMVRR